jgi:predicted DNA binding CopG/RHH family protein
MERRKSMKKQDENFDKEFEESDFGEGNNVPEAVLVSASQRKGRPRVGRKFNVTMPEELIALLQKAGEKRGVGYQTMIRMICTEQIREYVKTGTDSKE